MFHHILLCLLQEIVIQDGVILLREQIPDTFYPSAVDQICRLRITKLLFVPQKKKVDTKRVINLYYYTQCYKNMPAIKFYREIYICNFLVTNMFNKL